MAQKILFFIISSLLYINLSSQVSCSNNWLNNTNTLAGVQIGDLDVSGNTITVEALINSTSANPGGRLYAGDIVSKHHDANDINYLLRPSSAEITTTNGYFITPPTCDIHLNKTYHVAMVYDGTVLKFYRNGFLMSQVKCSGNLFQNNYKAMIGEYATYPAPLSEEFVGYINEVRIWNVARTQEQIKLYMNSSLPTPVSQVGLLAYYTFDDLKNKQGNSTWDGTLIGNASIQKINPVCKNYVVDSCDVIIYPVIQKSNDTTICSGQSVSIYANTTNALDYSWQPSAGLSNSNIANPLVTPASSSIYYVTIHAVGAGNTVFSLKDSVKIFVSPLPKVLTVTDTSLCVGNSLQLNATGAKSYFWSPAVDLTNASIANPIATPQQTTIYTVLGIDSLGCKSSASVLITLLSSPSITHNNDTAICIGGSVNLHAAGGIKYQWQPANGLSDSNIPNPIASPVTTTLYRITVSNINLCYTIDSVLIKVISPSVFSLTPSNPGLCIGDSMRLSAFGGSFYQWIGLDNSPSIIVKPQVSTNYRVRIYDSLCKQNDTLQTVVTVYDLPKTSIAKSNDIDCFKGWAYLSAYGGVKYLWSPGIGLSDSTVAEPLVTINQTTKYFVTVSSSNGCISKDTITVYVLNNSGNLYLMPNAFTPNKDGLNDLFGIKGWGGIKQLEFSIYNRWGERVFYTNDTSKAWDGNYNGLPQDRGTYIYYIKADTFCGSVEKKGTVVLIR